MLIFIRSMTRVDSVARVRERFTDRVSRMVASSCVHTVQYIFVIVPDVRL